MNVIQG